jgi:hypothetical protein
VVEEENKAGYLKFLDNYAILTVEEGMIEERNSWIPREALWSELALAGEGVGGVQVFSQISTT